MDVTQTTWYKNKLTALFGVLIGLAFLVTGYNHYQSSVTYRPLPQQIFLNTYNQPIGPQDLLVDATHNPQYRKTTDKGETAEDFLKEFLLDTFTYNKGDLESGSVLKDFLRWCSEEEALAIYQGVFVNLGQQRIVMAQDGLVRARIIGDMDYLGWAQRPYESTSGLDLKSMTHKFKGKVVVTVYGDKSYPTVYSVTAIVQRALIQDKMQGYQLIDLEME